MQKKNGLPPVHPGEILRMDVLPEVGLSVSATARALGVSRQMLRDILAERRPLSAVMWVKISQVFGSTPEMWMRLQSAHDLKKKMQSA
jgi:antitoxin HigA-1